MHVWISITWRSCPTYGLGPKCPTIVFMHIWEPFLDLYQVSSTYRFQEQNSILYDQDTYHVRLEHISSFLVYDIHSQSECSYCAILYFLFYICCHGFLCMPALIFITDDLHSNKIKLFHISIILYSTCMLQTKCHHIQFTFHNNYYRIC